MAELLSQLSTLFRILLGFVFPGVGAEVWRRPITKFVTDVPLIYLFFLLSFVYLFIKIFNKLRRSI